MAIWGCCFTSSATTHKDPFAQEDELRLTDQKSAWGNLYIMVWAAKEKIRSFTNIRSWNNHLGTPGSRHILHRLRRLALAALGSSRKHMGTSAEGSQALAGVKFCRDRANTKASSVGKSCNTHQAALTSQTDPVTAAEVGLTHILSFCGCILCFPLFSEDRDEEKIAGLLKKN